MYDGRDSVLDCANVLNVSLPTKPGMTFHQLTSSRLHTGYPYKYPLKYGRLWTNRCNQPDHLLIVLLQTKLFIRFRKNDIC